MLRRRVRVESPKKKAGASVRCHVRMRLADQNRAVNETLLAVHKA